RSEEATKQLYQWLALPFTAAQYTICNEKTWTMHFDRMFSAGCPTSIGQNSKQATYYAQWLELQNVLDAQSLSRVRVVVKNKFDLLMWIPYTQSDKMW
ncbi:hypothetical protein BS17DRAFT_674394, partial [Gyrodon lividus]